MNRTGMMVLGFGVALLMAGSVRAAEVEITGDFASSYVFRGATFNDGAVFQPGVSVSGLPISFGVWGNLDIDDYDDTLESGEFSELDLAASYGIPVDVVELEIGYTEYTYPQGGGDADREAYVSIGKDVILAPSAAVYFGIDGGIAEDIYVELGLGHTFELGDAVELELSAALGYLDPSEGESGFSHVDIAAGVSYSIFSAGVTYVGQIDDDVLADVDDGGSYDAEVVGSIGVAYSF